MTQSFIQSGGDWLTAVLIASCSLQLDGEIIPVAALQLGLNRCVPPVCRCGSPVDKSTFGTFMTKPQTLNNIIARAFDTVRKGYHSEFKCQNSS